MKSLTGMTAVVIGGGSGVGRGVCLGLAQKGLNVVVADIDTEAMHSVSDEIRTDGGKSLAVETDSTDVGSLTRLAEYVISMYGQIDILINTVGVILEKRLEDVTESDWSWVWKLNVMAQINAVNVFMPLLKRSGSAHIVLTGSGAGLQTPSASMALGAYTVTKHALTGYAKSLRNEVKEFDIKVSLLCPAGVEGNLASTSAKSYKNYSGDGNEYSGGE